MERVYVPNINAEQTMVIVRDLRAKGLVQGPDFSFRYNPRDWDQETFEAKPPGTEFMFADAKWATFFRIKYG